MFHEKPAVALKHWAENTWKHPIFQENSMLIRAKHAISLYNAGISVKKIQHWFGKKWTLLSIKSVVSSCSRLLSRHATKKQTPPYRLSMAQPVKIEFRLSLALIHWLNTIFHSQNFALQYISPELNSTWLFWWVCFQVLVVYCCLMCKLLPHQVWPLHPRLIRTTNTNIFLFQGLKATYRLAKLSFSISAVSTWD